MSKLTKQIGFTSVGMIFILSFFHYSFGQIPDEDILNKHIDWKIEDHNIYQVCAILAVKGIPIGIEDTSDFNKSKHGGLVRIKSGTLREILNSLIKQEPDFNWTAQTGVVNIFPVHSRDEILKGFLDVKVENSFTRREVEIRKIADYIHSSELMRSFLTDRNIKLGIFTGPGVDGKDGAVKINTSDADVRGMLNQIVKMSSNSKGWSVQRTEDGEILLVL